MTNPTRLYPCVLLAMWGALVLGGCSTSDGSTVVTAPDPAITTAPLPAITTTPVPAISTAPLPAPTADDLDAGSISVTAEPVSPDATGLSEPLATPDPNVGVGREGRSVEEVQDLLNDFIGYADVERDRINEDGGYGPNTKAAQESFERYAGLSVDGIASAQDRATLEAVVAELEADAVISVVAFGDESNYVGAWQERLNSWLGLSGMAVEEIVVDDKFGADTEEATIAFERAAGLQIDGIVEPEDRAALRSAIARLRVTDEVTVVSRGSIDGTPFVVNALLTDERFCLRFVSGVDDEERCATTLAGEINTAYFTTVNGISIAAGTANPDVATVVVTDAAGSTTILATRRIGDTIARAWVTVVDDRPASAQLLRADGSPLVEMLFVNAPIGSPADATITVRSASYNETFVLQTCTITGSRYDLSMRGSQGDATVIVIAQQDLGLLAIEYFAGPDPLLINGTVASNATSDNNEVFALTGTFVEPHFAGETFTATGRCN